MKHLLPPLNSVRVFEVAARHLSFRLAAKELGVTPGAVSQQIQLLEENLGTNLFERRPKGLALTDAGARLAPVVSQTLQVLSEALNDSRSRGQIVRFSGAPTLCTRWLVPRLGDFFSTHPDVKVQIDASMRYVELISEPFDVAIRYGNGIRGSLSHVPLFADDVIAVCGPTLAKRIKGDISKLKNEKLLCWATQNHWLRWFEDMKLEGFDKYDSVQFSLLSLAIDAALAGQGVVVASERLIETDLASGRLVRLPFPKVSTGYSYYVVGRSETLEQSHVKGFVSWVINQARREVSPF